MTSTPQNDHDGDGNAEELLSEDDEPDDDATECAALIKALVVARDDGEQSQAEVAAQMHVTQSAVSDLEAGRVDPRLSSLQRYARAVGRTLQIALDEQIIEVPGRSVDPMSAASDDIDQLLVDVQQDPVAAAAREDAQRRQGLIQSLVAARSGLRLSQGQVAGTIGTTQSAVSELESGKVDPRLSVLQRYARATNQLLSVLVVDSASGRTHLLASLVPEVLRRGADPLLVEAAKLAASAGIEDVLRGLLLVGNQASTTVRGLMSHTPTSGRASRTAKRRALGHLAFKGWLAQSEDQPARTLALSPSVADFVGISIRPDHVRGTRASLGSPARSPGLERVPLAGREPADVLAAIEELVDRLTGGRRDTLMGIGVELSGPVDGVRGIVRFAPDLQSPSRSMAWHHVYLAHDLTERLGVRTIVENDANALATFELLLNGAPGGLVVVNLSESNRGIGAGLVFNGGLLRGKVGEAGEIGHTIVVSKGRECRRCEGGRRGCLETVASGQAIATKLNVPSLAAAAERAVIDPGYSRAAFSAAGLFLGRVLGEMVTVLDPAQLVVYGPEELVDTDQAGAAMFSRGLDHGLQTKGFGKIGAPRLVVRTPETGPLAAAAVAMNSFVSAPLDWAPDMDARSGARPGRPG